MEVLLFDHAETVALVERDIARLESLEVRRYAFRIESRHHWPYQRTAETITLTLWGHADNVQVVVRLGCALGVNLFHRGETSKYLGNASESGHARERRHQKELAPEGQLVLARPLPNGATRQPWERVCLVEVARQLFQRDAHQVLAARRLMLVVSDEPPIDERISREAVGERDGELVDVVARCPEGNWLRGVRRPRLIRFNHGGVFACHAPTLQRLLTEV